VSLAISTSQPATISVNENVRLPPPIVSRVTSAISSTSRTATVSERARVETGSAVLWAYGAMTNTHDSMVRPMAITVASITLARFRPGLRAEMMTV
jgi:hypothetical protein